MTDSQKALSDYRAKRDFAQTPEPAPDGKAKENGSSFVVQKHAARRLHFDFRLEIDGVLKSWAVTRGPSRDPAEKRLAVRTEDHPLDYGTFEGVIPKGQYGGGTVMLWDRGEWEPLHDPQEGLKAGKLHFRLHGERMTGGWALVRMRGKAKEKRENWLLIKERDGQAGDADALVKGYQKSVATGRTMHAIAEGEAPAKTESSKDAKTGTRKTGPARPGALPKFRKPQLATLEAEPPAGQQWLHELKYDGYRCLAAIAGQNVRLYTRNGKDWTRRFGRLVEPLAKVTSGTALIDGEVVVFDKAGQTDFGSLPAALSNGDALTFFAFDLLNRDGKDLTKLPLTERKSLLVEMLGKRPAGSPIQFSTHVRGEGEKVLAALCDAGHEGIISKRADAPYRSRRSRDWLKIKCTLRQEFVIAGWSPSDKRNVFASLLVGAYDNGQLHYRGRVGTGFSLEDRQVLQDRLTKLQRKTSPMADVPPSIARTARWTSPRLVAEIAYAGMTQSGVMRHPSFIGLREDKAPEEVIFEGQREDHDVIKTVAAKPKTTPRSHAEERFGVRLTSADRVVYPQQGLTKAGLADYYALIAERMLPLIAERPLSLVRCPQGRARQCFFQKHDSGGFPEAMKKLPIKQKDGELEDYFYIRDAAGLIAGVQMGVLEFHIWGSRTDDPEKPDRLVFDLDPDEGLDFADVRQAAVDLRARLEALGLECGAMVTGGKGVHVVVPLERRSSWEDMSGFAKNIALQMADNEPDRFVATMSKAKRKGRIFVDWLRNQRGSTAIAPYSTRSREGAPIAVPVSWQELGKLSAANTFKVPDMARRITKPDPWAELHSVRQSLTRARLKAVS